MEELNNKKTERFLQLLDGNCLGTRAVPSEWPHSLLCF
jgi:hypothetical protein